MQHELRMCFDFARAGTYASSRLVPTENAQRVEEHRFVCGIFVGHINALMGFRFMWPVTWA